MESGYHLHLWKQKITIEDVARRLCLPPDELEGLIMGLIANSDPSTGKQDVLTNYDQRRVNFKIVK